MNRAAPVERRSGRQLGQKRLDPITTEDVQRLKHGLREGKLKTVNNVLTVLNLLLKKAVEREVIDEVPCAVRLLKTSDGSIDSTTSPSTSGSSARLVALTRRHTS